MSPILTKLLANKYATWSVAAYVLLEVINQVLDLWFPDYAVKTDETIRICSKAIVAYAIMMTAPEQKPLDKPTNFPPTSAE